MVITVKFDGKLVVLTAIYIFIGIAALIFAYPALSIWLPSNSSEMASWVQAFGSIGAIFGAFWVATYSANIESRRQRDAYVVDAQVAAIGAASPLKACATFLTSSLRLIGEDRRFLHKGFVKLMLNRQSSYQLPDISFVEKYSKIDPECASLLSIAIEARRQLLDILNFVSEFEGPIEERHKIAIGELLLSMELHVRSCSETINRFLAAQGVPLYEREPKAEQVEASW